MLKVCSVCGREKDILLFHKNKNSLDGRLNRCIQCVKEYRQSKYEEISKRRRELYRERREMLFMHKLGFDEKFKTCKQLIKYLNSGINYGEGIQDMQ